MIPARISGCTRALAAPADWTPDTNGPCAGLLIRDEIEEGLPIMTSCWEPTPAELQALNNGGKVYLKIVGAGHPPVMIYALGPG